MNECVISQKEYDKLRRDSQLLEAMYKAQSFTVVDTGGNPDPHYGLPEFILVAPNDNSSVIAAYKRTETLNENSNS